MTQTGSFMAVTPIMSRYSRRLIVFSLLFAALTAVGLTVVYEQLAQRSFRFDMRLLHPETVLAVCALLLVYYASDGLRLHYTLRALGYRLPLTVIARLVFINLFFANITPMATGGGFAQIWYIQRQGVPLGRATAATTIRTVLAVAFIFSLAPLFLLFLDVLQGRPVLDGLRLPLALFVTAYLAFFAVVLFKTRWLIIPLSRVLAWFRRAHLVNEERHWRWQFRMHREMLRFARGFSEYLRGRPAHVVLSVFFTALFLLSLFSFPALLIDALDYDVSYPVTLGLMVVTTFIMYFSPTPGAAGISEGVFGAFFSAILGGTHLVLVVVSWRFLTIYLGMIIGLVLVQQELKPLRSAAG